MLMKVKEKKDMKDKIVNLVFSYYGITTEDMKRKENSHERQILCYLLKKHTNLSVSEIGKIVEKDHATVIIGNQEIAEKLKESQKLQEEVNKLEQLLDEKNTNSWMNKFRNFLKR